MVENILKIKKNIFFLLPPVIFLLVGSLLGTAPIENEVFVSKRYEFPRAIIPLAYYFYFLFITLFLFLGFLRVIKNPLLLKPMLLLIFSYFILMVWSFFTYSDQLRYFSIFLMVLLCPVGILYMIERVDFVHLARSYVLLLLLLLFLSAIYSYLNFSMNFRISGIYNNSNLMGMWLVSSLAVTLYFEQYIKKQLVFLILAVIVFLVLLTGSRLAFGVLCFLLVPYVLKHSFLSIFVFVFTAVFMLFSVVDLGFRAVEIGSAISDSGRGHIWSMAIQCIYSEPLLGNGMLGAQNCVNTVNVHNSYLRIALMLGIPLASLFFIFFFSFIAKVLIGRVNLFIKFYFLGLPLLFFAEDYVVGLASPFFPFYIFMLALFLFDLRQDNSLVKEVV